MHKKPKSKSKPKRLKPNKESSTALDVDLWEQNEDRFTAVELPGSTVPNNSSCTVHGGTFTPMTVKMISGDTITHFTSVPRSTPSLSPAPVTIGGVDSHAALILLDSTNQPDNDEPERGNWTGRFDFLLSLLGYSVGLGNVWRFPYLCYNNGGGAFLIPFTIMLIIAGLPLMFMELSFGQYASLGPVAIYRRFCPLFRGLGTGMIIVSAIVMLYYNLIIAWTIFYFFASLCTELPWQNCEKEWSTEHCFSYEAADQCDGINGTFYLRNCYNTSYADEHNITELALHALKRPPAEEYFTNYVLGLSSGIEETGSIRLSLAACLLLAWIIVFLCLCKGVQSSGKVVYFTALFPYVVLVILFFRGVTLPGAGTGIIFYLTPDWKQLANAQVWGDAAVQIFFALSPAWGGLITLSSYNQFSNNCYKDSLIVAICNICTSFFAGLVIFSIIGFLAHELDVEVDKVVDQGAGLAFIVYPEVVTRLPISPVWSVLFFVMLLTLGLDSQFALMETVTTAILDKSPNLRQNKIWVVLFVGVFGYLGGLVFTTNSGMYWLQLMDKYAANWSVLLIAISECVLIAWIYGSERFLNDIQSMIGKRSWFWNFFWSTMWRYITPATLLFILFFNWVEYKPASYGHYVYPFWADAVGWVIGLLPVLVIFLVAFQQILKAPKQLTFMERIKYLLRPTAEWGPAGRPCSNFHREGNHDPNYPITPMIPVPNMDDEGGGGDNGSHDDAMQLRERVTSSVAIVIGDDDENDERVAATSTTTSTTTTSMGVRNGSNTDYAAVVVLKGPPPAGKQPGPSILKNSKNSQTHKNNQSGSSSSSNGGKHKNQPPDISPSKQPLIESELRANDSVGSLLNEKGDEPAAKQTANKKFLSPAAAKAKTPAKLAKARTTKVVVVAAGTLSSGRERVLTTFGQADTTTTCTPTTTLAGAAQKVDTTNTATMAAAAVAVAAAAETATHSASSTATITSSTTTAAAATAKVEKPLTSSESISKIQEARKWVFDYKNFEKVKDGSEVQQANKNGATSNAAAAAATATAPATSTFKVAAAGTTFQAATNVIDSKLTPITMANISTTTTPAALTAATTAYSSAAAAAAATTAAASPSPTSTTEKILSVAPSAAIATGTAVRPGMQPIRMAPTKFVGAIKNPITTAIQKPTTFAGTFATTLTTTTTTTADATSATITTTAALTKTTTTIKPATTTTTTTTKTSASIPK